MYKGKGFGVQGFCTGITA